MNDLCHFTCFGLLFSLSGAFMSAKTAGAATYWIKIAGLSQYLGILHCGSIVPWWKSSTFKVSVEESANEIAAIEPVLASEITHRGRTESKHSAYLWATWICRPAELKIANIHLLLHRHTLT